MKTIRRLLLMGILVVASAGLFAQNPPDPNGDGGAPGSGNDPVGGRATVSGGIILLLAMGVAYGGKKIYNLKRKRTSVTE